MKVFKTIGSLFKPKMPEIAPIRMPDLESPAAKLAARKKIRERAGRGREGTIYGGAFTNTMLGGTA